MLDNLNEYNVILASKSPRRQELLGGMGVTFQVQTKETDESFPSSMDSVEVAAYLSKKKSLAFSDDELPLSYLLITADTIVVADDVILGKPSDAAEARSMLMTLADRRHRVVTGVTVRNSKRSVTFSVTSEVCFSPLEESEIKYYIDNFRPFDKAGAYGIQEWIGYVGISELYGSFYNVMGLPTQRLFQVLKTF